ncbi:MAG: hypothetical protein ACOC95_08105 [Planctomycetota bacterium]
MSIEHWMVFGTFAEQRHFEYPRKNVYSGVIINANMAAHAPGGLAAFLIERTAGMKYLIDPLTHAFQHDRDAVLNKDGEPKSSIKSLAESYGEPVASRVGSKPLNPGHFRDRGLLRQFVKRCLHFQRAQLSSHMESSKAAKYLDGDQEFAPYAVVAPYFYVTESTIDDWLPINTASAQLACEIAGGESSNCFASVVIGQGILTNPSARAELVAAYQDISLDGFLLWVDGLDERQASSAELLGLLELAKGLRGPELRDVLNLHGGYFSVLAAGALGGEALTGVAHGPEFGEYREVVPVGGGIPIARYYVPDLHSRVRYREAVRVFTAAGWLESAEVFYTNVCNCNECRQVVGNDPSNFKLFGTGTVKSVRRRHGLARIEFPTMDTRIRCLRHYLQRKYREYAAADGAEPDALLENLDNGIKKFEGVAGLEGVAHLRLWKKVFCGSS